AAYNLSVTSATASPGYEQTCTVSNGSGTANGPSATLPAATISCSTVVTQYTLGGTISGLASDTSVTLTDGITPKTLNVDGSFSFTFAPGAAYNLSVTNATAPTGYEQTCTVSNGSGTANGPSATLPAATISCSTLVTQSTL